MYYIYIFFTDPNENQLKDGNDTFNADAYAEDFDSIEEYVEINEEFGVECEHKLPRHFRCASHTLNLIATTDSLKAITENKSLKTKYFNVIKKCTSVWKYLRSPKRNENLKAYLGISLKRPVVTRWNSTYDCIVQLLTVDEKLLDNSKIKLKKALNSAYFKFLHEFVRCSEPLACVIDRLQADNFYYGVLLPTLVSVKNQMSNLIKDKIVIDCKPLAQDIINGIDRQFEKLFDFSQPDIDAVLAAIFHPQFKGRWLTTFSQEEQRLVHERFSQSVSGKACSEPSNSIDKNCVNSFNFGNAASTIPEFQ